MTTILSVLSVSRRTFLGTVLTLLLGVAPVAVHAFGIQVLIEGRIVTFVDVPQTAWFTGYVRDAAELGIVHGYEDTQGRLTGHFGPADSITLAEALKIVVEGAGYDEEAYGSAVASGLNNHWASPYIAVAQAEHFAFLQHRVLRIPWNDPATRAEVSSFFTSAFRVETEGLSTIGTQYDDVDSETEFGSSIEALSRAGVVSGDTDVRGRAVGRFRPQDPIKRAEVVKMIMEARAAYGTPGVGRRPSEETVDTNIVMYAAERGFSPSVIRIEKGAAVRFHNTSTSGMWVASDPHPTHRGYAGFDAGRGFDQGEDYFFTFSRLGTWIYHNHLQPKQKGTVVVVE